MSAQRAPRAGAAVGAVERVLCGRVPESFALPVVLAVLGAGVYGGAMGSFSVDEPARAWFIVFGAIKTPLLLAVTTLVCLPAYGALMLAGGLRGDLRAAVVRLVASQGAGAIALASLAPVVLVAYTGVGSHARAVLVNAVAFAAAAGAGQVAAWRAFGPMVARDKRHAVMLAFWFVAYAFVGVQLGWTLRPFVGTPGTAVEFFREGAFTNAYVAVARIAREALGV